MLRNPFPNAFGLDIGDLSIKLVQLSNQSTSMRGPHYELKEARSIHIPHGLIAGGELQQPEKVRHYIQKLLKGNDGQKPIKSPWAVVSLPETKSFIKLITVHKNLDEIIDDDIALEAKKHIPFAEAEKYYLDWRLLPQKNQADGKTQALIGATPRQVSDNYTYLSESVGLGVIALEIEALSIARSMITFGKRYENEARALLDIGATTSNFIIYDMDSVRFSTSIAYSGELITTTLAQNLKMEYAEAEEMKKECGLACTKEKTAWMSLMNLTSKFAEEISKAINFYYSHFHETNRITHITLCGGGTNLKKLPEILTQKLNIECMPGHPWKNLFGKKKIKVSDEETLTYATAIGLGIRAADNPFIKNDII